MTCDLDMDLRNGLERVATLVDAMYNQLSAVWLMSGLEL